MSRGEQFHTTWPPRMRIVPPLGLRFTNAVKNFTKSSIEISLTLSKLSFCPSSVDIFACPQIQFSKRMYEFFFEECIFQIHSEQRLPNAVETLSFFDNIRHTSFQKYYMVVPQNRKKTSSKLLVSKVPKSDSNNKMSYIVLS